MEQSATSTPWIILLSGLAASAAGILFLWKTAIRASFFRAINPTLKPPLTGKLSRGLLVVGGAFLLVFLGEVAPFHHSRPYWIVALSLVLSPLATLGFASIFLISVFKRKP